MNKIILTMMCSAVVFPPLAGGTAPVPEKVTCAIADRQAFQSPDCVHLTGWIGSRIDANEKNRMAKMDPERLLASYRRRPGWQSFDGEHMGKWLHAATLAWVNTGDPELRKKIDYTGTDLFNYQVRDAQLFSADATLTITVTSDIFVLNGSFETPNPPTTSPGGPWGNLDSGWTNNLGNYARRHDATTPPGGGLWILNLNDKGAWIEQDLGVSVDAGSTLSLTFSTLRDDIFKSPNGGQGKLEVTFQVGPTKYTELFDLSRDTKDTWVTKTFTKKITNAGNLTIRFSHVDIASTGDRITTSNANNGPGEIGIVAIDKVSNVSVKPKSP